MFLIPCSVFREYEVPNLYHISGMRAIVVSIPGNGDA